MGKEISKKLYAINDDLFIHWCPACDEFHPLFVNKPSPTGCMWVWNGDKDKPSFTPSIRVSDYCHYLITDGMLVFLSDSRHLLQNQTVSMPDVPD